MNRMKDFEIHDYLNRGRKSTWQNSASYQIKTLNELGIEGIYPT